MYHLKFIVMKTFKVHFNLMKAILLSMIFTGSIFLVSCNDIVGSDSNLTLNLIQPIYNPPADSIYAFPVKPGMEIWSDFESHAEKVDACQIPDQKLQNLTTAGLIKACLDYPLLLDFSAYDNLQDGFNAVVSNFNGFQ